MILHPSFVLLWGAWRAALIHSAPGLWLALVREEPRYRRSNAVVAHLWALETYRRAMFPEPLVIA